MQTAISPPVTFVGFDCEGQKYSYSATFLVCIYIFSFFRSLMFGQDSEDAEFWRSMAQAVENNFVDTPTGEKGPLHVHQPANSRFSIRSNEVYESGDPNVIQNDLRTKNIVIPNSAGLDASFTLKGLSTVADVDEVSEIQGRCNPFNFCFAATDVV